MSAVSVVARLDVPPHDNSAMDGFALCRADLKLGELTRLPVAGYSLAGLPTTGQYHAAKRYE